MKASDHTDNNMPSRDEVERLVVKPAKRLLTTNDTVPRLVERLAADSGVKEAAIAQEKSLSKFAKEKLHDAMMDYVMAKMVGEEHPVLPELGNDKRMAQLRNTTVKMLDDRLMVYKVVKAPAVQAEIEQTVRSKTDAKLVADEEVGELRTALIHIAIADAEDQLLPRTRHNIQKIFEDSIQQLIIQVDGEEDMKRINHAVEAECNAMKAAFQKASR
ncbi:MAG: hypothetical protein ACN2B6_06280 [Rickettsiales bacterium]